MREPDGPHYLAALLLLPLSGFVVFLAIADWFFPFPDSLILRDWWWGGVQLWDFPTPYRLAPALLPLAILLLPERSLGEVASMGRRAAASIPQALFHPAALLGVAILGLWIFRSVALAYGDADFYARVVTPQEAFSLRGVLIRYDSIGATLLYTLGYRLTNLWFSLDVVTAHNVLGLLAPLGFLIWVYTNRARGRVLGGAVAVTLLLMGNWSQATLGPVEYYGQVLLAILVFAILGVEALRGREPLWKPALAFSLGAFFHLMIGWIFPALAYLVWKRWRHEDEAGRTWAAAAMVIPAFLTGSLAYYFGFDLSYFSDSHALEGKIIPLIDPMHAYTGVNYQYSTFDPQHLVHILTEALLMGWPGVILLTAGAPYIRWKALWRDRPGIFLLLILAPTIAFNFLWNPDLRFWRDQDLFCWIGLGLTLAGVYMVMGPPGEAMPARTRRRLLLAALVGAATWRLAVMLHHSVLSENYLRPEALSLDRLGVWIY